MNPLGPDLEHVLSQTAPVWDSLQGARLFVTGGTGFFGCWLLESFIWAWESRGLDASITVLTRSADAFRRKAPHLAAHPAIVLVEGDVRDFVLPGASFTHVIHAAFDGRPENCGPSIVEGTRRVLDLASESGATRFLFTSSGAVYGKQPAALSHLPETWQAGDPQAGLKGVYADAKRSAEALCARYGREGIGCVAARCFAFVGPYLPLDAHFAIGNFIRDRIEGRAIQVRGDGTSVRSYLYAADLAIWLWTLLVEGRPGRAYNVGSERAVSIAEAAHLVSGGLPVEIEGTATGSDRYVPCCERARSELRLREMVSLEEGIARTLEWQAAGIKV